VRARACFGKAANPRRETPRRSAGALAGGPSPGTAYAVPAFASMAVSIRGFRRHRRQPRPDPGRSRAPPPSPSPARRPARGRAGRPRADAPGRRPRGARRRFSPRARAAFRWRLADGSETFSPGLLAICARGPPRFADLLEQLAPEDTRPSPPRSGRCAPAAPPSALTLDRKGGGPVDAIGRRILRCRRAGGRRRRLDRRCGRRARPSPRRHLAPSRCGCAPRSTRCRCRSGARRRRSGARRLQRRLSPPVDARRRSSSPRARDRRRGAAGARPRPRERARATQVAQSESQHIVVNGSRRLVEFTEAPLPGDGGLIGYARDSPTSRMSRPSSRAISPPMPSAGETSPPRSPSTARQRAQILQHRLQHAWRLERSGWPPSPLSARSSAPARAAAHPRIRRFRAFKSSSSPVHLAHRAG